jgi:hypothetical protein
MRESELPRDEKYSADFQAKNILTPSYMPFRELKTASNFSKGETGCVSQMKKIHQILNKKITLTLSYCHLET